MATEFVHYSTFLFSWGCHVTLLSPYYSHEQWLSLGADEVLDFKGLKAKTNLTFTLVINTGGPLLQAHSMTSK